MDMNWKDGRLSKATIRSKLGHPCRIRSRLPLDVKSGGEIVKMKTISPELYEFATVAGGSYKITPHSGRQ
jgi:alpha-L-fucosidase 2